MIFVYLLLFLTSLIFYIQFEGPFSFYLFFFVASYPIIFGAITFYLKKKLRISFETQEITALKGANVPVNIVIDNPTRIPVPSCDITVRYKTDTTDTSEKLTIHSPVFPNNTQVLTLKFLYKHYGSLSLEITKIKVFDILKCIRFRVRPKTSLLKTKIVVFPNLIPIDNQINDYSELGLESENYSKNKKGDDPSEIFNLHEYVEGDKMSRIHWKLSAKQPELMVKDYSLPIVNGVLIAVDLSHLSKNSVDLDRLDCVIDTLSALSFRLSENEITHTILWCTDTADDYDKAVISDFDSYMTETKRFITEGYKVIDRSVCETISELSAGTPKYAHLILCSTQITDKEKNLLVDSGFAHRYTAVITSDNEEQVYSEDNFTYVPVVPDSIAECIETIAI